MTDILDISVHTCPPEINPYLQPPVQFSNDIVQQSSFSSGYGMQNISPLPSSHFSYPPTPNEKNDREDMPIAKVYDDEESNKMVYKCCSLECRQREFGRLYDFKRHYDGAHATNKPKHWCQVEGCERSEADNGRPFHRKDKLKEHVQAVHL
jgi:hypothetical protein